MNSPIPSTSNVYNTSRYLLHITVFFWHNGPLTLTSGWPPFWPGCQKSIRFYLWLRRSFCFTYLHVSLDLRSRKSSLSHDHACLSFLDITSRISVLSDLSSLGFSHPAVITPLATVLVLSLPDLVQSCGVVFFSPCVRERLDFCLYLLVHGFHEWIHTSLPRPSTTMSRLSKYIQASAYKLMELSGAYREWKESTLNMN